MGNKKDSRTNRLRPEGPFDDESSYINLQKEFNNTRYSRDRNIRQVKKCNTEEDNWDLEEGDMERLFEVVVRQVKRSEEASDLTGSPLSQRAAGVSPRQSSGTDVHQTLSSLPDQARNNWDLEEGEMERFFEVPETRKGFGEFKLGKDRKPEYVDWRETEMVGFGDYRGYYPINENSNYKEMISKVAKEKNRYPCLKGKFLTKARSKYYRFCCDTGSSCNLIPARKAALNGLKYEPLHPDEPNYLSVTNHRLTILGQTTTFIRLEKVHKPIKISFLVCSDHGDEALLSLDTLVELSIVPPDFPTPMNSAIRDHKVNRIEAVDGVEEVQKVESSKWGTVKERIESMTSQLSFPQENRKEDLDEDECEAMKQSWLKDFSQVFKEDLTIEDRINIDPVQVKLVEDHLDIPVFHHEGRLGFR